jgi:hypothetical protein
MDSRDDPQIHPVAQNLPQGPNPNWRIFFANPVSSLSVLEDFKTFRRTGLQVSSSLGQFRRSSAGINTYTAPPAPTEGSEIFTPGPMVDEREIFFM